MNLALRKTMTLPEFLAWEERQGLRHEFDGARPVAMTGGTFAHALIQGNLAASLIGRLRGKPCRFVGSDLKIEAAGNIRYPDGFVTCSAAASTATVIRDPVVIFEILSPSTSSTDRIVKNEEYRATPSVRRYVILEQDRVAASPSSTKASSSKAPTTRRKTKTKRRPDLEPQLVAVSTSLLATIQVW